MIKSELVARLAERNPHLRQADVERAVSAVFEQMAAGLARGDRVEIRGFGSFSIRLRGASPSTRASGSAPTQGRRGSGSGTWSTGAFR